MATTLTAATRERFINLAQSIDEEGRDLPMGDFTNQMKGYITNMKKAGLVKTYRCEGDPERILWIGLTEAGRDFCRRVQNTTEERDTISGKTRAELYRDAGLGGE